MQTGLKRDELHNSWKEFEKAFVKGKAIVAFNKLQDTSW